MDEKSFGGRETSRQLWEAVSAEKDEKLFTESSLQKLVKQYLVDNRLPELLSTLRDIIQECNNNCYGLYKTTIVMKYLCSQYPSEISALLDEQSDVLKTLSSYVCIDEYGKDRGINVRINAEQLMEFIESKSKSGDEEAEIISTVQNSLDSAANRLLQTLISIGAINSDGVLKKLRTDVALFNKFLPGPMTPQKYIGLDTIPEIDDILYGKIVERIVDSFDENWPIINGTLDPSIERLIVVDGASLSVFHETLTILTDSLKESTNAKANSIVLLLEKLIKSEALVSCITEICKLTEKATVKSAEAENKWQSTIQTLVSLPSRVANRFDGKVADCFLPDNYAKIMSLQIGRTLSFLHLTRRTFRIQPNLKMLSMLMSKAVIVLGARRFEDLFHVMSAWCSENPDDIRDDIINVLSHVDRPAIQPIAVTFLKHKNSTVDPKKIFGELLNDTNWRHVFTVKIPLMSYHKDENLLRNFIVCLSTSSDEKRALTELFIKLLDIWGDRSAMNHTSLEHHEYITKLIVMSVREVKTSLRPDEKDTARRLLFSGTSAHLESTQHELRAMGMITGEIVIENLTNSDDEPKLKYDYEGMPKEVRELVERLRDCGTEEQKTEDRATDEEKSGKVGNLIFSDLGQRKLYELGVNCGIVAAATYKTLDTESVGPKECSEAKVSKVETHGESSVNCNDTNEDLDSDDDLVPYDMSNDTAASEKLRPSYLRDFRDNLVNAQSSSDPNIFEESMRAGEDLILAQLPNDDATLGVELLEILISLREISCADNFELLKFKCCVAVTIVCPKEAARYLCNEFHKKIGHYSIKDRLFILDVLAEAARKLSKIAIEPRVEAKSPERVQRKIKVSKVSLKIDTSGGKKYATLYDDDFEVTSAGNRNSSDWEEIVERRIKSNTRIFAHATKRPITTANKFNDVASSFFYPLVHGFRREGTCMKNTPASFEDQENILLVNYLKTLSAIMMAAENCTIVPKMAKEILDLAWALRYHSQAKVRLRVIENTAAVAITLPKEALTAELMEMIFEIRAWLCCVSDDGTRGDPDSSCRTLGRNVVALIDSVFHSTLGDL